MTTFKKVTEQMGLSPTAMQTYMSALVSNQNSLFYKELSAAFTHVLQQVAKDEADAITRGDRGTAQVPYRLEMDEKLALEKDYDDFHITYTLRDRLSVGLGAATWYMQQQAMFTLLKGNTTKVAYVTDSFEHVIFRNREYVRIYCSEETPGSQALVKASMRAVSGYVSGALRQKRPNIGTKSTGSVTNRMARKFANDPSSVICFSKSSGIEEVPVVLMDYSNMAVNWEQHVMFVSGCNAKMAYASIPMTDEMLLGIDCYSKALGAWITFDEEDGRKVFHVDYEWNRAKNFTQDYDAYLNFFSQSTVEWMGKFFFRETMLRRDGYVLTRTLLLEDCVPDVATESRLWFSPAMSGKMMLVSYRLKAPFLDPSVAKNYVRIPELVDSRIVKNSLNSVRALPAEDFTASEVARIVRVVGSRDVAPTGSSLSVLHMPNSYVHEALSEAVFLASFEERFVETEVCKRLSKDVEGILDVSRMSLPVLTFYFAMQCMREGFNKILQGLTLVSSAESWRERILRVEQDRVKLPYFEDALKFMELSSFATPVVRGAFSNDYAHFDKGMPMGKIRHFGSVSTLVTSVRKDIKFGESDDSQMYNDALAAELAEAMNTPVDSAVYVDEVDVSPKPKVPESALALQTQLAITHDFQAPDDIPDPVDFQVQFESVDELVPDVPTEENPHPVDSLQRISDAFGHTVDGMNREHDEHVFHSGDLHLTMDAIDGSVNTAAITAQKSKRVYESNIVTMMPPKGVNSTESTIVALATRNTNIPQIYDSTDPVTVWDESVVPALEAYLGPMGRAKAEHFRQHPIIADFEAIGDWLESRDPAVYKRLLSLDLDPTDMDLSEYETMLKLEKKPPLNRGSGHVMKPAQTVNYHTKEKVAHWSPFFRKAATRFTSLVQHRAIVSMMKSPEDLQSEMNRKLQGYSGDDMHIVACDHSSYDKSQARVARYVEMRFYVEYLGLSQELVDQWWTGQADGRLRSAAAGVKLFIELQRRTGDATTALGNTVLNFLSFITILRDYNDQSIVDGFMGDDMVRFSKVLVEDVDLEKSMNSVFNFSVKEIKKSVAYYLSGILVKVGDRWWWTPDIYKTLQKLGKSVPAEPDQFFELHQSFADRMSVLGDQARAEATAAAAAAWYDRPFGEAFDAVSSLWTLAKSRSTFRSVWRMDKSLITL